MKIVRVLFYILIISVIYHSSADTQPVINNGFGDYLLVPAGEFLMGDNFNEGETWELPVHPVYLDPFYIGKFELPNCEYKIFIEDGGYQDSTYWSFGGYGDWGDYPKYWFSTLYRGGGIAGNDSFPVVGVTLYEANAYCSWLSEKTGKTYRIPTEAEWEKAARGTDQRRYPWGNNIDSSYANYYRSGDPYERYDHLEIAPGVTPVGYYDGRTHDDFITHDNSSPYGAYDMAGNIFEWCSDWWQFEYYSVSPYNNPKGPAEGENGWGTMRGSFWTDNNYQMVMGTLRSAFRSNAAGGRSYRKTRVGFRCLQEVNDSTVTSELPARFSADIMSGEVPLTICFTDESEGDPTSWSWDFGDGNFGTEQNPAHEYTEAGRFEVRLEISNDTSKGLFILFITVNSTAAAENIRECREIIIYPNPATGKVLIDYSGTGFLTDKIEVLSTKGRLIYSCDIKKENTEQIIELPDCYKGTFFVRLFGEGTLVVRKLVIL